MPNASSLSYKPEVVADYFPLLLSHASPSSTDHPHADCYATLPLIYFWEA